MEKHSKIFIAGHRGMVGSAIERKLRQEWFTNFCFRTSAELDLRNQKAVEDFFALEEPEYVFLAAAKVGGILANNTSRADFLYDNLAINTNVIHASYKFWVKKLLFLGSSCIYPKMATQPLREEYLLTWLLEQTNEPYAIAKIAGIKLCESYRDQYGCNFISAMPTNLYGPNDNYDPETSHVLPALISKIHLAKQNNDSQVVIWGTWTPLREFLHVDDLANACYFLMLKYNERAFLNVGSGVEISILDLAKLIAKIVWFEGAIITDTTKPDGTPRKLMDNSKINDLWWKPIINLELWITFAYNNFFKAET